MAETAPRELMVLVERVVRPLSAPMERQQRLRTELLQHVEAIYAEELARDHDQTAALQRTQARFGEPQELTAELRRTIRWNERIMSWCERKPQESSAGYSLRLSITLFTVFILEAIGVATFCSIQEGVPFAIPDHTWLTGLAVLLGSALTLAGFLFVFLNCSWKLGEEWRRPVRRWWRLALFASPLFAFQPCCLAAAMFFAGRLLPVYHHLWQAALGALLLAMIGVILMASGTFLGIKHHRNSEYRREWAELDLEAA